MPPPSPWEAVWRVRLPGFSTSSGRRMQCSALRCSAFFRGAGAWEAVSAAGSDTALGLAPRRQVQLPRQHHSVGEEAQQAPEAASSHRQGEGYHARYFHPSCCLGRGVGAGPESRPPARHSCWLQTGAQREAFPWSVGFSGASDGSSRFSWKQHSMLGGVPIVALGGGKHCPAQELPTLVAGHLLEAQGWKAACGHGVQPPPAPPCRAGP